MMTINQNRMQDPSNMSATLIHSNSLLKLSTKSMPCICDVASRTQQHERLITGWGRVLDGGDKTAGGKGGGAVLPRPRKPFPSRLYEMTSHDSRPIDYVFRHYTDTATYMEQYRRHHTVMDTGRTMQQAPAEVFVMLHHAVDSKGTLPVKGLPMVRGKRSAVLSKTSIRSDHSQDADNRCKDYNTSLTASQKMIKAVDRKLDSKVDSIATYKMADASTDGSFLNIIGELRKEAVRGKLGRVSRNSAGTGSSVSQSESNHWYSSNSSYLRHNSAGLAPSGDARVKPQSFGQQPIRYLGKDDVDRQSTWDKLWRENFLNFRSSTAEVANKKSSATNARGRHKPRGRVNHATALLCTKRDKENDCAKSHSQNDVSSDQDSDSEQITSSDYLGSRSLFKKTASVGHLNRRINVATRPPINFGLQQDFAGPRPSLGTLWWLDLHAEQKCNTILSSEYLVLG